MRKNLEIVFDWLEEQMNKPPAFQFYADDFLGGTTIFNTEETGAYILLLCHQWNTGGLPKEEKLIRRIAKVNDEFDLSLVLSKFKDVDGKLKNERMEQERQKQIEFRARQSENGKMGGRPKTQALTNPNPNQTPPSPSPSASPKEKEEGALEKKANFMEFIPMSLKCRNDFMDAWTDWCEYRKQIRHSLVESTAIQQLKKMDAWGATRSVAAIRHTIENGWQGLFEPVSKPQSSAKPTQQANNLPRMK